MVYPSLQTVLEHFGVFVAAITGVLAARGKRIDLFGVLVLALVTAFGGGTTRDLLAGDLPVVWLRNPGYLINATLAALLTFFFEFFRAIPKSTLMVADAFALAFFTMLGVQKGVMLQFSAPVAVLLGVVTGVAGGMLRDVLIGKIPMVFRPEIRIYATASLCGAVLFVSIVTFGLSHHVATVAGLILVLALRLAGIYWNLALPVFEEEEK